MAPKRPRMQESYGQLSPQEQQRYDRMRSNKGAGAANKWMQGLTQGRAPQAPLPDHARPGMPQFNYNDPNSVAGAAGRYADDSAMKSTPNIENDFGSREWSYDENGRPVVKEKMSDEQRGLYQGSIESQRGINDAFNANMGKANAQGSFDPNANNPYDHSNFGDVKDRTFNESMGRFDRDQQEVSQRRNQQFEQSMADRGIPMGSELYNRQASQMQRDDDRSREDYRQSAYNNSVGLASTAFNDNLKGRGQAVEENRSAYDQHYDRALGLAGVTGRFTAPQFGDHQTVGRDKVDIAGIASGYYGADKADKRAGADRDQAWKIAQLNARTAAGGRTDPFALATHNSELAKNRFEHEQGFNAGLPQPQGPSTGEIIADIGGSVGAGVIQGVTGARSAQFNGDPNINNMRDASQTRRMDARRYQPR